MFRAIKRFVLVMTEEILVNYLRGPLIVIALTPVIASTGAWQYFANTWSGIDQRLAAKWSAHLERMPNIAVVGIDDTAYHGFFQAKSPIDRQRTAELLSVIDAHAKSAKRITIDLELSPMPGQEAAQLQLDEVFLRNPQRWVLAAVNAGSEQDIALQRQWRQGLCAKGVSFGLPYIPTEFGYPKLSQQYVNGLADMSLQPPGTCADPADPFEQKAMLLAPAILDSAVMIPFSGDLEMLGMILDQIDPEWIFIGGAWGQYDIYGTPFGDRFGVQIHLAALAGELSHEREASTPVQLLMAFAFVTLCTITLKRMDVFFDRWLKPPTPQMVGHRFYLERMQPIQFIAIVFVMLWLMAESLALLRAYTGFWMPSSIIACTTMASILLNWNWGQVKIVAHDDFHHMWQAIVRDPIRADMRSMATAGRVVFGADPKLAWGGADGVGRGRAAAEGLFALLSVLMQTIAPLGMLIYGLL